MNKDGKSMNFDLNKVMQNAMEIKNNDNQSESGERMKVLYPSDGNLKVKLLFNPASGLVTRKFDRHTINGTKIPCLGQYGQSCPICKQVEAIQNAKGLDLWKLKRLVRGIAFAQYIESDYTWDKPEYQPKPGEVILLMFPWSIYKDINKIIAEAGAQAETVVATNTGRIIKISKGKEGNRVVYSATLDPWAKPYDSCQAKDGKTAEQVFEDMLMNLPDLNERVVPSKVTDEIIKQCKEMSDQLYMEYLQDSTDDYQPQQTQTQVQQPQQPQTNQYVPQPPQGNTANRPECFGCHAQCDANRRLICPHELLCKQNPRQ